jgi:hypothetical protein
MGVSIVCVFLKEMRDRGAGQIRDTGSSRKNAKGGGRAPWAGSAGPASAWSGGSVGSRTRWHGSAHDSG